MSSALKSLPHTAFRNQLITIAEAADVMSVSSASVRNWVKTGYLVSPQRNMVTTDSISLFMSHTAGREKLTKRANKSCAGRNNHADLSTDIYRRLTVCRSPQDVADISSFYESTLSEAYRNKEGIFYTPTSIAASFFAHLPNDRDQLTFCDPCCGTGVFLLEALRAGIKPQNISGFDIDHTALAIAKKRLSYAEGGHRIKIEARDFLSEAAIRPPKTLYSIIFTNPPWGKKLTSDEKRRYAAYFDLGSSSADSSSLFCLAGLSSLQEDGFFGMLLPYSFFHVASHHHARSALLSNRIISISDVGNPFPSLLTGAKTIVALKSTKAPSNNLVHCKSGLTEHYRTQHSFLKNPGYILNSACSPPAEEVIARMRELPHKLLKGNAKWALGIVTGNNSKFVSKVPMKGYIPVYRGSDVYKNRISDPTNFIPADLTLYQQVAPRELYEAEQKLIYRFISSDLVFFYDDQRRYMLNSANMVIVENTLGVEAKTISNILNTDIMNFYFRNVFQTHKVLRSDLEKIPIHVPFMRDNPHATEEDYLDYLDVVRKSDGTFRLKE